MSEAEALAYWMDPEKETFVAEPEDVAVSTYYMRPNQAGGGRHICNCNDERSGNRQGSRLPYVRGLARTCAITGLPRHAVQVRRQHE